MQSTRSTRTQPHLTSERRLQTADHRAAPPLELLCAAFRDVHGPSLHGFALLMTLGDQTLAARLAADALAEACGRVGELRHPERAAGWLRSRVLRGIGRRRRAPELWSRDRIASLVPLGVDDAMLAGLTTLERRERAALIAATIERLDRRDVAVIVGRDGRRLDNLLARARASYLDTYSRATVGRQPVAGLYARRIRAVAAQTQA